MTEFNHDSTGHGTDVDHPVLNPANLEDKNLQTPPEEHQWGRIQEKTSRRRFLRIFGSVAAGAVLLGGGAVGVEKLAHPDRAADTNTNPKASAPAVPGKSASPEASQSPSAESTLSPEEQMIKKLELPLDADNGELAMDMWQQGRLTEWENAGATLELARKWTNTNLSADDADKKYLQPLVEQNAQLFATALFPADWQKHPRLVNFVKGIKERNYFTLQLFVRTSNGGMAQGAQWDYKTWETADESSVTITHQDTDSATIVTEVTQHDNSDKNRAQYYAQGKLDVEGQEYSAKMIIGRETDRTVITDILLS